MGDVQRKRMLSVCSVFSVENYQNSRENHRKIIELRIWQIFIEIIQIYHFPLEVWTKILKFSLTLTEKMGNRKNSSLISKFWRWKKLRKISSVLYTFHAPQKFTSSQIPSKALLLELWLHFQMKYSNIPAKILFQ